MTDLDKLIEAVESGKARQVDFICLTPSHHAMASRAYEGSLDAAKALHESLLPGWAVDLWAWDQDDSDAQVYPPISKWANRVEGENIFSAEIDGHNPARAWLLAILRAHRGLQCP